MERSIIDEIKEKILSSYRPEKLVLFGSAASGELERARDIDLCVIKEKVTKPELILSRHKYSLRKPTITILWLITLIRQLRNILKRILAIARKITNLNKNEKD